MLKQLNRRLAETGCRSPHVVEVHVSVGQGHKGQKKHSRLHVARFSSGKVDLIWLVTS